VNTTQRLEEETLDRVRNLGKMGESFNVVLNKVLDEIDDLHDRLDSLENEDESEKSEDS